MSVEVSLEVPDCDVDEHEVMRVVAAVLEAEGESRALSVVVVDDATIHDVNRRFLDHDYPTDVIAFDLGDDDPGVDGEVVVSWDTARREAGERGIKAGSELLLYCVHGTLHLLGYDDKEPAQRERMHARQRELLAELGHGIPE